MKLRDWVGERQGKLGELTAAALGASNTDKAESVVATTRCSRYSRYSGRSP